MSYLQHVRDPSFYPDGELPDEDEIVRRDAILRKAFNGIIQTKIALYIVPRAYDLAEICDIFSTLNLTGTKVSTVDLIHANIYSDTANAPPAVLVRDQIDELGQFDGALGWSSSRERPELIAQFAAAIHMGLDQKPEPRPIGSRRETKISGIKSGDLLALPAAHWRSIFDDKAQLASCIGGFQQAVAGGPFGMDQCPYPASAAIYVALHWHLLTEQVDSRSWTDKHLNHLFRAFFWRNALSRRYDQGFLTQLGTDLRELRGYLYKVSAGENFDHWKASANAWLESYMGKAIGHELLYEIVSDGSESGALRRSAQLLLYARATFDALDPELPISHGTGAMNLHHVYPKDWCANNRAGELADYLNPDRAKKDWVNSAANLMPMARTSNLFWRKKSPAQVLEEREIRYDMRPDLWSLYFISRPAFEALAAGPDGLPEFWHLRASALAEELARRMAV